MNKVSLFGMEYHLDDEVDKSDLYHDISLEISRVIFCDDAFEKIISWLDLIDATEEDILEIKECIKIHFETLSGRHDYLLGTFSFEDYWKSEPVLEEFDRVLEIRAEGEY